MKRYLLIGLAALGLSTHASAQDNVTALLGNLQPTANALTASLEDTLNTLATTQSTVDTSAVLADTLTNTGSALTGGTQPLGGLEPGLALLNADLQQDVDPLALTMDDPSLPILDNFVDLSRIEAGIEGTLEWFDPTNPDHLIALPLVVLQWLPPAIAPTVQPLLDVHDQLQQDVLEPLVGNRLCLLPAKCGFLDPDYEPPPPGALDPILFEPLNNLLESVNNL